MRCDSCGHENPDINRFCGMCGSILDRRRQATSRNVVPMPSRAEDTARMRAEDARRSADMTSVAPLDESKPEHLADEHFSAPGGQEYPQEQAPFSIFGVETGEPLRTHDVPQGVHGPSFLGLGDSDADTNGDYLLEEDESHGGRTFLLFVALLIVGGLAYLQYRADRPVTSIWAAIKSRATGEPTQQQRPTPQEPNANGVAPTQPTFDKSDASRQSNTAQPPASAAQAASANENPSATDQDKANATDTKSPSPDKSAAARDKSAATTAKPPQTAQGETPRKNNTELMAKAQHPQSDRDTAEDKQDQQAEETTPARRGKPSPATESRSDRADDALVARAQGYLYGKGGRQSCNTALSLLKQAAERGNPKADSQLGAMYATGNCAPFDRAEAYRWFNKAAEADPGNSYLQRSRDMMWREMSPQERRKVLE